MLNPFNFEQQANKRVHKFLRYLCRVATIEPSTAKLVINIIIGKVSVHLYDQNNYLKTISFSSIAEFFGKEYDESTSIAVYDYFLQLSKDCEIDLSKINIVICETKAEIGAHLYEETKYKKRIPTLELLTHFTSET
jgi:hypothetical protein